MAAGRFGRRNVIPIPSDNPQVQNVSRLRRAAIRMPELLQWYELFPVVSPEGSSQGERAAQRRADLPQVS